MPAIHAGMTNIAIFIFCGRAQGYEPLRGEYSVTLDPENLFKQLRLSPNLHSGIDD